MCAGVRGCMQMCAGMPQCGMVCADVHGCVRVFTGLCVYARVFVGMHGCVWDEFSEFLLETRFLTSANYNIHPLRFFSKQTQRFGQKMIPCSSCK